MAKTFAWIKGAGIGAGLMYLFDPDRGRQRRARLRDQATHIATDARRGLEAGNRDLRQRMRGLAHDVSQRLQPRAAVDDSTLNARVRAALGHAVSNAHAVETDVADGRVRLRGAIAVDDVPLLLAALWRVPGVREIEDRLDVQTHGSQAAPQQGGAIAHRHGDASPAWTPATHLGAGFAGGLGMVYGFGRGRLFGTLLGLGGLALAARAATNAPIWQSRRRGIDIQKSLRIHAPVERVFELWSNFENFPQFMTHVKNVRRIDERQWQWTVDGPAGAPVEFISRLTAVVPNEALGWRTESGALVQHAGLVRFHAEPDGSTTVHIHFTYNPVAGGLGHVVAKALGSDPQRRIDDDLMRMKHFIEGGKPPHDAAAIH